MLFLIRGHRGSGKSSFLKRLSSYLPTGKFLDLDEYISEKENLSVDQIFTQFGETKFRELEKKYYEEIQVASTKVELSFLSVGGGFSAETSEECIEIFITRDTDKEGRIFFDRPRLMPELGALEESQVKFKQRHSKYLAESDFIYWMEEGFYFETKEEKAFWQRLVSDFLERKDSSSLEEIRCKRFFCLLPEDVEKMRSKKSLIDFYRSLPIHRFELRDDLLELDDVEFLIEKFGFERLLFSFRRDHSPYLELDLSSAMIDWDISLKGDVPSRKRLIISSHPASLDGFNIESFNKFDNLEVECFKLAVPIHDFKDLTKLEEFKSPKLCVFPISKSGRWRFSRNLLSLDQSFCFVRNERQSTVLDQEHLFESLLLDSKKVRAAVLGNPIYHSFSPALAYDFLSQRNGAMIKIGFEQGEIEQAFSYINMKAISLMAVTSPLKEKLLELSTNNSDEVDELGAANTVYIDNNEIFLHNTDLGGFSEVCKKYSLRSNKTVIWGGGGTLNMMKKLLPEAICVSARSGMQRDGKKLPKAGLEVLIWAISNTDVDRGCKIPRPMKDLKILVDLSYKDSSLAREYAIENGLEYISGLEFLKAQALLQQDFWVQNGFK